MKLDLRLTTDQRLGIKACDLRPDIGAEISEVGHETLTSDQSTPNVNSATKRAKTMNLDLRLQAHNHDQILGV